MRPRRPRFDFRPSLRLRVLASFALVIALSLFLAGIVSVWLIRDQQAGAAEKGLGRLVDPLSQRMEEMQLLGYAPERIASELATNARFYDVRILLLDDSQRVVLDTNVDNSAIGEQIVEAQQKPAPVGPGETYESTRIKLLGSDLFLFTPAARRDAPAQLERPFSNINLVLAVPAGDVNSAWASLLPRLLLAGGMAALFAVVVGTLLANRITRPIQQMTHASEAMAKGDYSQRVEVGTEDDDEVANLGRAFNQMAQQVDRSTRAMRQLLANVSHELKTPLTSIQGYSQAMVDGVIQPDELSSAAGIVHQEAERMRSLVDDLLYLSQLEAGQSTLTLERIDLDAAVAATANRFRYQAETAGVEIRLDLAGDAVMADERRIEQVLANLLDNALRFAGDSDIELSTKREGAWVFVTVHNKGRPIPPEDLPHIFDRFYQVDQARTRNGHSGLGLAIVRELVQAHGGDVTAQSSPEAGTTFSVRLRAADVGVPTASPALSA